MTFQWLEVRSYRPHLCRYHLPRCFSFQVLIQQWGLKRKSKLHHTGVEPLVWCLWSDTPVLYSSGYSSSLDET